MADGSDTMDIFERVREQFNYAPYPATPLDYFPKNDSNMQFPYCAANAFYRRDGRYVPSEGLQILDAGCGSGVTTLRLCLANPGAQITAIDLSPASVAVARERLDKYGYTDVALYAMPLEQLSELGQTFDYIHCHETLYLLPDPQAGLQSMAAVLSERGVIRANLHSKYQRHEYFRAQELFAYLGATTDCDQETAVAIATETLDALAETTQLHARTWRGKEGREKDTLLANHILEGDKGFTILDLFDLLRGAELDLIDMVNWRHWNVRNLFKPGQDLPDYLQVAFESATPEQLLHTFELLHPVHRLLDFWCGRAEVPSSYSSAGDRPPTDWETATIYLQPVLRTEKFRAALDQTVAHGLTLDMRPFLGCTDPQSLTLFANSLLIFHLLWQEPMTFVALRQLWQRLHPIDPLTLAPTTLEACGEALRLMLPDLEDYLFIMIEFGVG
ncbi:MAG: class I SAM-dependent methyltransferase [Oscillatoriales cyanobacterium SM2_2_1]|nr:class I SAM-dependent methyltransferase [Oscillatoriales cyanobacterium SM2_2_1]